MSVHLLEVRDLQTSFNIPSGEVRSVNGISFNVDKNEILGIVGESGSGKSVTAYSIMQILDKPGRIVGGSIKFKGQEILNIPRKQIQKIRGEKISIIFQDAMTSLNPVWSIGNQLRECIKSHPDIPTYSKIREKIKSLKKQIKENSGDVTALKTELALAKNEFKEYPTKRCLEMLNLVGINEPEKRLKQYPYELSGGMLQRVMIAMALICEPELIIADEPTTALDVTIQAQILELLINIQKKMEMGIIIITHDLGVVAQICNRVNVMYAGRIVETGTCDDIFYNPKHEYTKGLINSIPKMQKKTGEKLVPIAGNPVDVFRLPNGCSFVPRCSKCMKICLKKYPNYIEVSKEHKTACFAYLEELVNDEKISKEEYENYLDSCVPGNKSFKKINLFDVEAALNRYKNAQEQLNKIDKNNVNKEELETLKFHVSDYRNEYHRIKKDFRKSIKNYFQSRGERKSIDKNDVSKKIRHIIHEFSLVAHNLSDEDFSQFIDNAVICTTQVNSEVNKEKVLETKNEYKKAKKIHLKKLFIHDVEVHNNFYDSKINYYEIYDTLKWKTYIESKKALLKKELSIILKVKRRRSK